MRIPKIIDRIFPSCFCFRADADKGRNIYLTFDDGPIDEVTPQILALLTKYNAKATFFCVADNIRKHPALYDRLVSEGHAIANHSYHHLQATKCTSYHYYKDILEAQQYCDRMFYRPPHAKLKRSHAKALAAHGFKIVLWTVVTFDYEKSMTKEKCIKKVRALRPGDIVLFHDSLKSYTKTLPALEYVLEKYSKEGYSFPTL